MLLSCAHYRYHYQRDPDLEYWAAQATTASCHCRGAWWYPSRCDTWSSWRVLLLNPYLGPTAFGRIPGFTEHIFPSESLPYLSLVANIGLCLFLFIVGLEINQPSSAAMRVPPSPSAPPGSPFRLDSELRSPSLSTINSPIRHKCRT